MDFSCQLADIVRLSLNAKEFIESRDGLSLISNAFISVKNGRFEIKTTNATFGFKSSIPVVAHGEFETIINCDKFSNILRTFPDGVVNFNYEGSFLKIEDESKRNVVELRTINATEFPFQAEPEDSELMSINKQTLRKAFSKTLPCVSDLEGKPILKGVQLSIAESENQAQLTATSTNLQKLAYIDLPLDSEVSSFTAVVPTKFVEVFLKVIGNGEGIVKLGLFNEMLFFKFDDTLLFTGLMKGVFPDCTRIVNNTYDSRVLISAEELNAAVSLAALMNGDKSATVMFKIDMSGMYISNESDESGQNQSTISFIQCEITEEPILIGIDSKLIKPQLRECDGNIWFYFDHKPAHPIKITPEKDETLQYITMPFVNINK